MTTPEPVWLTIDQAAERLQVSVRWIERAAAAGDLPEFRRNRARRYRPADVDALLQLVQPEPMTQQDADRRENPPTL